MAREIINLGSAPNDGTGDKLRTAFTKVNNNFQELYDGGIGEGGAQGVQGIQGFSGTIGAQGADGAQGEAGTQGVQGLDGASAAQGAQGAQGETGTQGADGAQAAQGAQGETGTQGAQGEVGATGPTGPASVSTSFDLEMHVSKDGNDSTGTGTILQPYLTITHALTQVTGGRNTIVIHPGGYTENPTITSLATQLITYDATGASTLVYGTVTIANTTGRIAGLKMTNLAITGNAQAYINSSTVDEQFTKSSSGYVEVDDCELQVTGNVLISGSGIIIINGNKINNLVVNNAGASVLIKGVSDCLMPQVTAGSLNIVDSIIRASSNTANAVTASVGTVVTLMNNQIVTPAADSVARVSIAGFHSIISLVYDKANSTLSNSLNSVAYFQTANVDSLVSSGNISAGNLTATGTVSATNIGNIASINLDGSSSNVLYGNGVFASALAGATGVQGATGTQGAQGETGTQGADGAQGIQGINGARTYTVTNSGTSAYVIDGSNNPTLNLLRGFTYEFDVNASGHPFWIQTVPAPYSSGNVYNSGITNNGAQVGKILFAVPYDAPSTLYYVCQFHSSMAGTINITDIGPQGVQGTDGAQGAEGVYAFPLANGTSNFDIATADGDVTITANSSSLWTFDTNGTLSAAGDIITFGNVQSNAVTLSACTSLSGNESTILSFANSSGDGQGYTTLQLIPDSSLTATDQYLIIDPTISNHIHIRAGGAQDNSNAQLIFGGENSHFTVYSGENPGLAAVANGNIWFFDVNGTLAFPDFTSQNTAFTSSPTLDYTTTENLKINSGVQEKYQTIANANGTVTHDCNNGQVFYHNSPDDNWIADFTNLELTNGYATTLTLVINQGATGYYANTIRFENSSATINWQGNTEPTPSNNRNDVITFTVLKTGENFGDVLVLGELTGF